MLVRVVWLLCVLGVAVRAAAQDVNDRGPSQPRHKVARRAAGPVDLPHFSIASTNRSSDIHRLNNTNKVPAPITQTVSGQFRGSWMVSRRGRRFQAYRGIRYAEPPVGHLRFQPPKPILRYHGMVDATEDGPACPAHTRPGYPVDEDCLVINVYSAGHVRKQLVPVIFFIHPGGFYSLSGRSDVAGPHYLLDRDVVLVTINYRIGSLGFLALGNKQAPGNIGFKDQVVALKWVQRNIGAFGGDPDLVTIAGCSAGAVSVMLHMVSPMSKGLFHRAISMSGSPTSKRPLPSSQLDLALKQARASKCPEDTTKLYECLKTKNWKDIAGSLLKFFEFGYDPLSLWGPVVEPNFGQERFLVEDPMLSIRKRRMHSVPFIITQSTGEFFWKAYTILKNKVLLTTMNAEWFRIAPISFILPRNESTEVLNTLRKAYLGDQPIANDTGNANRLGQLYGDAITGFPVHRMANLMCRHSKHPVYYAEFAYVGNHSHYEDPFTGKPVRHLAAHHDDLIYLFSLKYRFPPIEVAATQDSKMVDKMTALWYNFAKYGTPVYRDWEQPIHELTSVSWPAMKPAMKNYLRIDKEFSVLQNLFEDRFLVWEELYPIRY